MAWAECRGCRGCRGAAGEAGAAGAAGAVGNGIAARASETARHHVAVEQCEVHLAGGVGAAPGGGTSGNRPFMTGQGGLAGVTRGVQLARVAFRAAQERVMHPNRRGWETGRCPHRELAPLSTS